MFCILLFNLVNYVFLLLCMLNNNNNNNNNKLQLGCYPVAVISLHVYNL
jgi:hypothetical protein